MLIHNLSVIGVVFCDVKAFISPPMESISIAMSLAVLFSVPLKKRCSMKCETPPISSGSCRDPTFTQTPMDTERDLGRVSDTTRIPLERVSFLYIIFSFY